MANKYNDILTLVNAGNNMGLSNTIKRDYGIPLDFTSVQETYDAAVIYAATSTLAYVGQTVAVGGKLYIISDTANGTHTVGEGEDAKTYDNYLAEVGSKTEGDGNTIELDGQTLKLAGLTGLDNSKTYVPSLVNGKLVWAEPDTSTAEGQAQEINALKTRTAELEATVNGVEAAEGVEAQEGLVDKVAANAQAIADETAAREAAIGTASKPESVEGAGDAVVATGVYKAIEEAETRAKAYADANDADTVYDDTQVKEDIAANASAIEGLQTSLGNVYTKTEVDGKLQEVNDTIAGITHFTTQIVESVDDVTAIGVLYLIKDTDAEGVDKYNEYLYIEGQGAVLIGDTTTDLSDYVTNDALAAAIADFVTTEGLASAIAGKADQIAVNEALALKANAADVVANSTFNEFKTANDEAIATARTGAVADVEAKGYAVAADVNTELAKKIENASIAHTSETQGEEVKLSEDGKTLNIFVDAYTKSETLQKIEDKITEINGGESAGEVHSALNSYKESNNLRVGAIETKNDDQDTAIAKAQSDATSALTSIADLTSGQVKTNTDDITAIEGRLDTLETANGNHESRIGANATAIGALQAADTTFTTDINTIKGNITALTTADENLSKEDARLAGLITDLTNNKANTADVYTKTEVYTQTETDTKISEAIGAIPAVDLTDYAKTADVAATYAKIGDAYTKEEADLAFMTEGEVDARINALIVGADPEGGKAITNIQNLVKYVDENASEIAALISSTDANTTKLAGIESTVVAYVNDALAAIVQPKASAEITVATDGTLGIGTINVNKLVQTTGDELILNGGSAI